MLKKTLELEDLLPPKPVFTLNEKELTLRPPNQHDRVWIKTTFGDERSAWQAVQKGDWSVISRVVYRLMEQASRAHFPAQAATVINDEGETAEVKLTGAEALLVAIQNSGDAMKVIGALNRALVISEPEIEPALVEEVKKSLQEINQLLRESTTGKSSISSNTITGGRKKKSQT